VWRAIVDPRHQLDDRPAGVQAHAVHALHAGDGIEFAQPHRRRPVLMVLDRDIRRPVGRRTMMLRPVELDPTAAPRAGQADQRGFDHRLVVNDIVIVCLVHHAVNAAAELGQDHQVEVFVFDEDRVPRSRLGLFRDPLGAGERINASARSLVDPLLQKHRVGIGTVWFVRWKLHGRGVDFYSGNNGHGWGGTTRSYMTAPAFGMDNRAKKLDVPGHPSRSCRTLHSAATASPDST